jgi:MFS family permease
MNFVNFVDRYILPGVQELVKKEFSLSDERVGALTFWFFVTYMCAAPLTGWLGDHFPRKPLIILSALLMSAMNLFTATVHSYLALNLRHAALGIAEASFSIYAPSLLADFYEPDQRNRVLTIFYTAIPVGAAFGFALGGALGGKFGWRFPFYVSAGPGILIAFLIWIFMKEAKRGETDARPAGGKRAAKDTYFGLAHNPQYLYATFGMAMVVFSLGGISAWVPSFLQRAGGYSSGAAGIIVGAVTVLGGLGGTAVGGDDVFLRTPLGHGSRTGAGVVLHLPRQRAAERRHRELGQRRHPLHGDCPGALLHPRPRRRAQPSPDRSGQRSQHARHRPRSHADRHDRGRRPALHRGGYG